MAKKRYYTIKEIVFGEIHETNGKVVYKKLEDKVLTHFPGNAFKKTHWVWYRYQCIKGKYAKDFNSEEKQNLLISARKSSVKKSSDVQTVPITNNILSSMKQVIKTAINYENSTGGTRKIGITGEVGEILACHHLKLRLCIDSRSEGYDAIDNQGHRVQIKTRRSESEGLPSNAGRIGTFSKHPFDYALLVILDQQYNTVEIWRAEYSDLAPLLKKHKRRNPNLSYYKKIAKCIWSK